MIHYVLQLIAFQLLFLVVYDLFLKKETFFQSNRLYLVLTPILSFVLPLFKIPALQQAIPEEYIVQLPAALIGSANSETTTIMLDTITINGVAGPAWTLFGLLQGIWAIGAGISLLFFLGKLYKIIKLRQAGSRKKIAGVDVILLPETDVAFSFFNNIFLGANLSETQRANIILHECIHIKQRHTLDLLFFEVQRILFWFNPLVYVYQNRMELLQEFIADANVALQKDKKQYYQELLSQVFKTESISFINTFFNHSLIKKRIVMLQKSKSKKAVQLKYLLLLPLIVGMLVYSSCTQDVNAQPEETSANQTTSSKSEVIQAIDDLEEAIAKKGNITDEEMKALKTLMVLTSDEGVNHKDFESVQDQLTIPFGVIDKIPTFPGCEGLSQEESKKCFSSKISTFVAKNFKVDMLKDSGLSGRQRIVANFTVTHEGNVVVNKIEADHPDLEAEALWTLNQLPKMLPGEQDGKKVGVKYSLPIVFAVNE